MVQINKETILSSFNKLWLIGTFLLIFGVALKLSFPTILTAGLQKALNFTPGSTSYERWAVNEEPYVFDCYFFNWTNSEQVYDREIKPKFEELGPYRFKLVIEKSNVTFNNNDTATYTLTKRYNFVKEDGTKDLSDVVTIINPVPLSIAYQVRNWNLFAKFGISMALRTSRSELVISRTVAELLFDGIDDPILEAVSKLPFSPVKMDKFGFFYKKNFTDFIVGPLNIHTRIDEQFGRLYSFESDTKTKFFAGHCGQVKGGMGEFVAMNRDPAVPLQIFVPEICSYATLFYDRQSLIKGVHSDKYVGKLMFDNGTLVPGNECFCNGECLPSGVLNLSACQEGAPVFASLPHFLQADPFYREDIEGMNPDSEDHNVFASYERLSGVVTAVALRLQVNLLLQPIKGLGMYSNVPRRVLPIFHVNQTVLMTDTVSDSLYLIALTPLLSDCAAFVSCLLGIFLIVCGVKRKQRQRKCLEERFGRMDNVRLRLREKESLNEAVEPADECLEVEI